MTRTPSPLRRGDIVACRFPLTERPHVPGDTARPCLALTSFYDRQDAQWKAVVAYGTSQRTRANAGYEIRATDTANMRQAGLRRPTRFILTRMRVLPLTTAYFEMSANGDTAMGTLSDSLRDRMEALLGRIAAAAPELHALGREASRTAPASAPPGKDSDRPGGLAETTAEMMDAYMRAICTGRRSMSAASSVLAAQGANPAPPADGADAAKRPGGRRRHHLRRNAAR